MKKTGMIIALLILTSCSSTKFVESWRNKEVTSFEPSKILVVGMTNKLTARKIFEEELTREFSLRGINAIESTTIFNETFTDSKKSEEEIDTMIKKVSDDGFDAILITALKGVDEKRNYGYGYYGMGYRWDITIEKEDK